MANLIKQIAIFNKEEGSSSGSWETKDIGASATNVSLATPVAGVNTNVEEALHQVLPNTRLSSGFLESNNGQLKTSEKSETITNFFKDNGGLEILNDQVSAINTTLGTKVSAGEQLDNLIETYLRNHGGGQGIVIPGLTPAQISNLIYPVGSIFTTFSEGNPELLGLGATWEKIEGKFLRATSTAQPNSNITGGSTSVTPTITIRLTTPVSISSYTPKGTISTNFSNEVASNYGLTASTVYKNRVLVSNTENAIPQLTFRGTSTSIDVTQPVIAGTSSAINILPSYITVHMWRRTELADADQFYVVGNESSRDHLIAYIVERIEREVDLQILTQPTIDKWEAILEIE